MAYTKLNYGGDEYRLDEETAPVFMMNLGRALRSGEPTIVEARLVGGRQLAVVVSAHVPIAVERGGKQEGDGGQDAMFV
ncbi:hypothetical protein [Nocardia cyriacigeorgica]|uniref:hypothetical protein n=1 Tax=Nocardia cyriacigeorgica TaxID=135487 RepID=UPI002456C84A|nr:hypothetical protein [Nocardia cyriacigeorgica]